MELYKTLGDEISKLVIPDQNEKEVKQIMDKLDVAYQGVLQGLHDIMLKKAIGSIYDLADMFYDAISHKSLLVSKNYSVEEARQDLIEVKKILMTGNIEKLFVNGFVEKIKKLK